MLYMLFNASFVHTHIIDGENNEASIIKIINTTSSVNTPDIILPVNQEIIETNVKSIYLNFYSYVSCNLQSLRAPPVI